MPRLLSAIVLTSLLACGSGAPAPAATNKTGPAPTGADKPAASPAAAACAEKVAAMRTLFAHGPGDLASIDVPTDMKLPMTSGGAALGDGIPVFVLADGGLRFNAHNYAAVADLRTALDEEFAKAKQRSTNTMTPFKATLQIVADARAPAAKLLELAESVPPEVTLVQVVQLAGDTAPPAPPTPPSLQQIFDDPAPDQRAQKLAQTLTPAIAGCKPIEKLFQGLAATDPSSRAKQLLDGLPGAAEACKCEGVDLDVLVPAVWQMSGKTAPSKRQLALTLSRDPKAEELRLPAKTTAADLAGLVEKRGEAPFRLAFDK